MAMGATTYEWVLGHERLLEEPDKWLGCYGDTPCWVFAHGGCPMFAGAEIFFVEGDVAPVHEEMADAAGGRTSGSSAAATSSVSSRTGGFSTRSSSASRR